MQKSLNKTISYWSLRKKILVAMVSLLLLLGLTSALLSQTILLSVLKTEFHRKGLNSARSLAANSISDILTRNTARLKQLIANEKNLDKDIAYVFIIDSSSRIIAHTFDKGFPTDLIKVNNPEPGSPFNTQLLDTRMGFIYDIAVPVLSGKSLLAYIRLGLLQNNIRKTINKIGLAFFGIASLIIIIAIFLAYRVSSLITRLEERQRIALNLHDCCAQDLANIIKRLELCEKLFKNAPGIAIKELQDLRENTRDVLNRTRNVIFELKSQEDADFDLSNKLTSYIEDYKKTADLAVKLEMPAAMNNIPALKAKELFYIILEALTNVKRHSQAKNINIIFKLDGGNNLTVNIIDDGKGFKAGDTKLFNAGSGCWGIIGMRQRAASMGGELVIDSSPDRGTRVLVNIPV